MGTSSFPKWVLLLLVLSQMGWFQNGECSVTYDNKAIVINGQRRILISGSIHYPRSTPEMWEDLIMKAKEGGLDVIETYVFWNVHEPSQGNYNFEGRYDLVRFLKTVQKAGLYAHLRIGPYVCAEWNFGGFPVWLKYVPGISFRTDNEPFKRHMKIFTEKIVNMMKSEKLFESEGGPIILSQIENEYGSIGKALGGAGHNYMTWAANLAVGLGTGVPWVMCKQDDAPDPIINTCNGFYCDAFSPNKPYKPTIWTEAWSGWFSEFGGPNHERPVQDLAFGVARFIQKGGSFLNYYMYHGGTNFGRSAGGPFITTSYDYDAPLDEYGLIRQPKYGHLKELHKAIKQCEPALVSADPTVTSIGNLQQAHVFASKSGHCAAFLANYNTNNAAKVMFNNMHYTLPPWSISILPDCTNVVFNTAKVGVQSTQMEMLPTNTELFTWETYNEDLTMVDESSTFTVSGLLEQVNVTRDNSDYLWYTTNVEVGSSESFLRNGEHPKLLVQSTGHALHVFINGELSGSAFGTRENRRITYKENVNLRPGNNRISLLSVAMGLPNIGGHYETWETGVTGPVALYGLDQGKQDLSWAKWTYQTGLKGEAMDVISANSLSSVEWLQGSLIAQKQQPLTWHKATFNAPVGDEPLALDMSSMGKGQVWINGQSIGRYWTAYATVDMEDIEAFSKAYQERLNEAEAAGSIPVDISLKGVQYEPVEPTHDFKHYVTRRESPWKVDGDSSGVSAKLKLLEQELQNLENIGENDLSKVPSLMKKQAKRYQALGGKIDDLCRRMENDPCEPNAGLEFRTQRQTEFLLEALRLQQRASETGDKLAALQTETGMGCAYGNDLVEGRARLTTRLSLNSIRNNFRDIQRNLEIWLARIIGDVEGILARDGASRVNDYYISPRYPFVQHDRF